MRHTPCWLLLLFLSLTLLLAACGSEPSVIHISAWDPSSEAEHVSEAGSEMQYIEILTRSGPAVPSEIVSEPEAVSERSEPVFDRAQSSSSLGESEYILNTSSRKFHLPSCSSVNEMKEQNRQNFIGTRDELLSLGYEPCGRCKP